MIQATPLKDEPYESDTGHLLNWVHYHETVSRFSMRHWRHRSLVSRASIRNNLGPQGLQHPPFARHRPVRISPDVPLFRSLLILRL